MKAEEAIEILEDYQVNGCGYCHTGGKEVEEAFTMAVEALKESVTDNKWEELRETIQEIHDNNSEKSDVITVTQFLLNLMEVLDGKKTE